MFQKLLLIVAFPIVVSASMIARYNFEEITGGNKFPDISGNRLNGTFVPNNPALYAGSVPEGSNALQLTGASQYVNCGNRSKFNFVNQVTLSAWVNQSVCEYKTIISKGSKWRLDENAGYISFYLGGVDGGIGLSTPSPFVWGRWHHVVATYNGSNKSIYIDGVLAVSKTVTGTILDNSENVTIGSFHGSDLFFNGKLDDVRIYDSALSAGEIWRLYNKVSKYSDNLVGYWNFNGDYNEKSGYGNIVPPTLAGTPTFLNDPERGQVLYLNGSSYLDFGTDSKFNFDDKITITGWIKPDASSGYSAIINKDNSWRVDINGNFGFATYLNVVFGSPMSNIGNGMNLINGEWHHFTATYNAGLNKMYLKFYIDGNLVRSQSAGGSIQSNNNHVQIGSFRGSYNFKGLIDDIRVYNCELPETEIKNLANRRNLYVANDGFDDNDGKTPETAWRTCSKVSDIANAEIKAGRNILFKKGDSWRENITINKSGLSTGSILYGTYGVGEKPLLLGSINLNQHEDWNFQSIVPSPPPVHSYYKYESYESISYDVANIIYRDNSGNVCCARRIDTKDAVRYWYDEPVQYFSDPISGKIYLYIKEDATPPDQLYKGDFECVVEGGIGASNKSYINIEDFQIKYCRAMGIRFAGDLESTKVQNINIKRCDISYIGGGIAPNALPGQAQDWRYGDGIELYDWCSNVSVENCKVWEIYEGPLTNHGHSCSQNNISFRNNLTWNSEASYMYCISIDDPNDTTPYSLNNIYFENNTCYNAGYGWSHYQHHQFDCKSSTDPNCVNNRYGWHLLKLDFSGSGKVPLENNIYIRNNIFYNSRREVVKMSSANMSQYQNLIMNNNLFYKDITTSDPGDAQNLIFIGGYPAYSISSFGQYQNDTHKDSASYSGYTSDLIFQNPSDFLNGGYHLKNGPNNMWVDKGYPPPYNWTGMTDIDGNPRVNNNIIDIGASEFIH